MPATDLTPRRWRTRMAFVTVPGLKGKVFDPQESDRSLKKKSCKDCFLCQLCSEDRCRVCRGQKHGRCEQRSGIAFLVNKGGKR